MMFAVLLTVMCIVHQTEAGYMPIEDPAVEMVVEDVPAGYAIPPWAKGHSGAWSLSNSAVLTGGSASASKNVLTGGSTSADGGTFTNDKIYSRTKANSTVGFGMIGGEGGNNDNSQKSGIEHNGGGVVNFLSKVQGVNNQGVNGASDMWKQLHGSYRPVTGGSYRPYQDGGHPPETVDVAPVEFRK